MCLQLLHAVGFPGEKSLGETGVKCVMLTEHTRCLYNTTASGSIWCNSFGSRWVLVAAGPNSDLWQPINIWLIIFLPESLMSQPRRRMRHTCRWFSYPFISSPVAGVSSVTPNYSNIQQIECKKRRCFLTLVCCFHNPLTALTRFSWPQSSSSSPLNCHRMHLC